MWDFEHGLAGSEFEISYTVPSQCAAALRTGTADVGIIPAAAYTSVPDLAILPGVAIASRRPVRSILLLSRKPIEQVRTVALDSSSMTSVALTKVLFARWWGGDQVFTLMAPEVETMLKENDAGLVIGDPALRIDCSRFRAYDLAEEWIRFTGKPFVFAFWAVRQAALKEVSLPRDLSSMFQESRDRGLLAGSLETIALEWGPRLGLSEASVRSYLTENIHYSLDSACLEGLELFYRYAAECGALPPAPPLHFLNVAQAAAS